MASNVVEQRKVVIVECPKCKTMYVPDREKDFHYGGSHGHFAFERCPTCKYDNVDFDDLIPLWKYNLIKWFRGGFS
jgi:hypothetical protein